jgi:multiple sugar transport system ATP-binding protein
MVCVTHDQEEALALGDRIAVLHGGRIHQVACPRVVYDKPTDQFVAGFIGQPPMNFVRGTIQERDASLWFVECAPPTFDQHNSLLCLPLTSQQAAFLAAWKSRELIMGLRPEHIRLAGEDSLPRTSFRAGVALHKVTGPDALLHLQFTHHQLIARIPATTPDQTGTTAAFTVDMDHARFFDSASTNALA